MNPTNNENDNTSAANAVKTSTELNESYLSTQQSLLLPDRSLLDNEEEEGDIDDEVDEQEGTNDTGRTKDNTVEQDTTTAENHLSLQQRTMGPTNFSFASDDSPLLESFVHQAARVQSLVLSALQPQKWTKRRREDENDSVEEPAMQRRRLLCDGGGIISKIAQTKTSQVSTLQHQIRAMETELSTLKSDNENLRSESQTFQQRNERTAEALRIAQRNASQARADADAAETTASNLAQTLQSLQAVVRETQDETRHLQAAHDEIQQKSTALQADLWQKEVRIACVEKEYNTLLQDYQKLERAQASWKQEKTQLQQMLEESERKIGFHERQWHERRTMDAARQQRVQRLEDDWRESQALLVESTAAQSTAAETQSQLRSDLRTLQQKSEELHERLVETQEKARQDQERHKEALQQAEQDGQQWHIQLETCQDQNERLRLEKSSLEKQLSKVKAQLATKTSTMADCTLPTAQSVSPDADKTSAPPSFQSLASVTETIRDKENTGNAARRASHVAPGGCVICGNPPFGLMKKCQCGKCDLRAHLSCARRLGNQKSVGLSVAHPGTPFPREPFLLCNATDTSSPATPDDSSAF